MSKVAIEGNASGTGTFTIAAPNSNSNYTMTLPTVSGTMMTTATSLDASQIPDGSITTDKIADANVTVAKLSATGTPSSSTFLRGDGSWQSAGGSLQTNVYTSSTTWTVPAGVTSIRVTAVGGGGGGGRYYNSSGGNGGGNGGVAIGVYTVTPGTTYTVTVGAGGGAANTGGTGGESWFGVNSSAKLLYATGGIGGGSSGGGGYNTDGTGYLGTLRNTGNKEGSGVIGGSWPRPAGSGTGALSYTVSTVYMPGCGGQGSTTGTFIAGGGVGGVVLVEYVG